MIWADRLGLRVAALIALGAFLFSALVFIGVGSLTDGRLAATLLEWTGIAELGIAIPLWMILRLGDRLFGGTGHRRAQHQHATERAPPDLRDAYLIPPDDQERPR